ncbi:chemotaxis-specific protein-glutamate methyltransferase CheB [Sphingomonas baiyangensis]|uniref:protein-glutamate methylesterase n=1 Tax=Sphingomonas baiyangensis TaxID=2572576 RepID=A0A4U1L235_9SPHN|nr:chemotaxis-specific protein-glutamate methyltransferase CheB [Sphingomonas baiyangensis]TKD50899.1 chemotaxis-specific protein-glutamate methyltransferase CheB [Sphingomonas baiyangensis]
MSAADFLHAATVEADERRVLIVDDSAVARAVLTRVIDSSPGFRTAGVAADADRALAFLAVERVDIILLDLEMPGVDGLAALPDLLAAGRGARILVVSSSCEDGAAATVQALALGACDTLVKPGIGNFAGRFVTVLRERLARLSDDRSPGQAPASVPLMRTAGSWEGSDPDIVAIGASTGGIHALSLLLRELPPHFDAPILITQHLPGSFMPYFAAQIAMIAGRPCHVGDDRMRIRRGNVYVAPGAAHLRCVAMADGAALRLSDERVASGCRPSADPMFASAAAVWNTRALCVVLSGMGRDGCEGARQAVADGATIVVQDEASSVVWGMPGAVAAAGLASAILPPDQIGRRIGARQGRR